MPLQRVGVIGHRGYDGLGAILHRLLDEAPGLGLSLALEEELWSLVQRGDLLGDPRELDALLTLGGDGTLLRGARYLEGHPIPILGVNLGRLGFLTTCGRDDLFEAMARLAGGEYLVVPRMALEATALGRDGEGRGHWLALNDVVLHKGGFARLVRLTVSVDQEAIGAYSADGLVISTPTGSTAYSLSAGGPVVAPTVESLIVTPVSPHTLAMRPLVLPPEVQVTVRADDGPEQLLVTVDGQVGTTFTGGEALVVRRADHPVHIVRFPGTTCFSRLRLKLGWGGLSERDGT
jgi:NAD+ kinase